MADIKITQLPPATSPVAPTDVLPVVQGGDTKRASIAQLGFLQLGSGAQTRTIQSKLRDVVSVKDFGAVGDGVTDDAAAIQAAVDSIAAAGGAVYFPVPGIYRIATQVTINSTHAVSLLSNMGPDNTSAPDSYIRVDTTIAGSVFNVSCRGGTIRGLWFRDPTSVVGAAQGTNAINAALKLAIFGMGRIEDCAFDGLLGSAIEVDNWIRGHISRVHIRDCGTAAKPAIWINPTIANGTGQVLIHGGHLEVCRGPYIKVETNAVDTKIAFCQFEADTALAASNQYFIHNIGNRTTIVGCGFNRNTATYVLAAGNRMRLSASHFEAPSAVAGSTHLILTGSFCNVSGCDFIGTSGTTGTTIDDQSGYNYFTGVQVYFGGNVKLGANSVWSGGGMYDLNTTEAYGIVTSANSVVSGTIITSANVSGGIRLLTGAVASGNLVRSNAGVGIRCESSTAVVVGNACSANTGGNFSFTAYPRGYSPNANTLDSADTPPLQASATVDPGNLADGASASGTITVTGAAVGDVATAQFPVIASGSGVAGVQVSASVTGNNTVRYAITNNSGGSADLDSGTLVVKVVKQ